MIRSLLIPAALLATAACGYTPPGRADTASPRYQADAETCRTGAAGAVNARNAKTGLAWFASPVTRWGQIDNQVGACMAEQGWGRTRACTPAELAAGNRTPGLVVTPRGVQCTDPPTRPG